MSLQTFTGAPVRVACNGLNRAVAVGTAWLFDNTTDAGLSELAEFLDSITLDASATAPEQLYRSAWKTTNTDTLAYTVENLHAGLNYTIRFHFVCPPSATIGVYAGTYRADGSTAESYDLDPFDYLGEPVYAGSYDLETTPDDNNEIVVTVDPDGAGIAILCGFEVFLSDAPDSTSLARSDTASTPGSTSLARSDTSTPPDHKTI